MVPVGTLSMLSTRQYRFDEGRAIAHTGLLQNDAPFTLHGMHS